MDVMNQVLIVVQSAAIPLLAVIMAIVGHQYDERSPGKRQR